VRFAWDFILGRRRDGEAIQTEGYIMRIIWNELKKIWNLKIVLVVAAFCAMYFAAAMLSDIRVVQRDHPAAEDFALCLELTQKYGTKLEPGEFDAFYAEKYATFVVQANEIIARDAEAQAMGVMNYADLVEQRNHTEYWRESDSEITDRLYNAPENGYALYKIDALNNLKANYYLYLDDEIKESVLGGATNELVSARLHAKYDAGERLGIIPWVISSYLNSYNRNLSRMLVFAMLILLLPLITSDRLRGVQTLQYTTKMGRRVLGRQFAAMMLSSVLLTTVLVLAFGGLYLTTGAGAFWNNSYSSFNSLILTTMPLTFGQYLMILAGMLYLWGLALSAFAFVLSRFCGNYIPLIAGGIVVVVASLILSNNWVFRFPLNNFLYEINLALFEPMLCGLLLAAGVVAAVGVIRRERRVDAV
jgi:hypothetical protein